MLGITALLDGRRFRAVVLTSGELHQEPQATGNGWLRPVDVASGTTYSLVANPARSDGTLPGLTRASDGGQHTPEVGLELGPD